MNLIAKLTQELYQTTCNFITQDALLELITSSITVTIRFQQQIMTWITATALPTVVYFSVVGQGALTRKLADVKAKLPKSNLKIYQLAYVSISSDLIRLPKKYNFVQVLVLLGASGAINAATITLNSRFQANGAESTPAQKILTQQENRNDKNMFGIYTHDQVYAKALAVVLGFSESPEVHGGGMYGHYHEDPPNSVKKVQLRKVNRQEAEFTKNSQLAIRYSKADLH